MIKKLSISICLLFFSLPCFGATWTVKTSGGDFSSVNSAINSGSVSCGDFIEVYDGTYTGQLQYDKTCSSGSPLTVRPATEQTAVILNLGTSEWGGLYTQGGGRYLQLGDNDYPQMEIRGNPSTKGIIWCDGSDRGPLWLYNLKINVQDGTDLGAELKNSTGHIIENCEFIDCGADCMELANSGQVASTGWVVRDNKFYPNGGGPCLTMQRAGGALVENNYCEANDDTWGFYYRDNYNGTVTRNNVIYDSGGSTAYGIEVFEHGTESSGYCVSDLEFYNNTIDGFGSAIVWKSWSGTCGGADGQIVKNNIFMNISGDALSQGGSENPTGTYDYNIFYNVSANIESGMGSMSAGDNNLSATNPNITSSGDRPDSYYTLSQNDPAGDGGIDDDSDIPETDYNGDSKVNDQWIGAFEYGASEDTTAPAVSGRGIIRKGMQVGGGD